MFKKIILSLIFIMFSINVFSAPGEGTVAWEPTTMTYGDANIFLSITYTAGATAWSAGTFVFIVPAEFPSISLTPGIAGYVTMTSTNLSFAAPAVDGRAVTFTVSALDATTGTLHLLYDNLIVPIAGTYNFNVLTGPEAVDAPASLAVEPDVEVLDPTATATVTETATPTPTATVTPTKVIARYYSSQNIFRTEIKGTYSSTSITTYTHSWNKSPELYQVFAVESTGNTYTIIRKYKYADEVIFYAVDLDGNTITADFDYLIKQ